jgi:threonine synthase
LQWVSEGATVAEGIRVRYPVRGDALIKAMDRVGGQFIAVEEADILYGRDQLARKGFYVEMTSAVAWQALIELVEQLPEPIVVVLTGTGLKTSS